jgi:S1-C subfamily serine protease
LLVKIGLHDHDVLVEIQGQRYTPEWRERAGESAANGSRLELVVRRGNDTHTLLLTTSAPDVTGTELTSIRKVNENRYAVPRDVVDSFARHPAWLAQGAEAILPASNGVGIALRVRPYSVYWHIGLRSDDVLTRVDNASATEFGQLERSLEALPRTARIELEIARDGERRVLVAEVQ